ncbi:alginate lyase family protein [Luteibacter sp. ME-Dv--P-043b]|jgi:hypothetical protein|uniref:alginate lyase family protein n=1 Tax=Luteibacter sp. ME-Dv--P-043b TaxID=3040291 RepID=UPI0025524CA8|nr:alginate lyase family protein [Luteibacter sp. ME-Dv--P-043b]
MTRHRSNGFPSDAPRYLASLTAVLLACAAGTAQAQAAATFVHPGVMHTASDIARIKSHLSQEPWASGYAVLRDDRLSSPTYRARGGHCPHVVRDVPAKAMCMIEFDDDANAAYQQAVMWVLSDDPRYATNAINILNAWSGNLVSIEGADAPLAAGLDGFKFVAAAELIRHSDAHWSAADVKASEDMFRRVFYPVIGNFAPYANGNWDSSCMKTMMAIGVYTNDWPMFNRALDYYYNGPSNGSLTHYVIDTKGETQESGRDQTHTQLGIGNLAEVAEVAWAQGFDLYAAHGNRLLAGFEYVASYNLFNEVIFTPMVDTTGKYRHDTISNIDRGDLRPVYEMVANHYLHRSDVAAPYTQKAALKLRPEGRTPNADNNGFGTLMFSQDLTRKMAPRGTGDVPLGFAACASEGAVCHVAEGTGLVAYGARGLWHYREVGVGQVVDCSAASFGPAPATAGATCSVQR